MTTALITTPSVSTRRNLALAHGLYAVVMAWLIGIVVVPALAIMAMAEPTMTAAEWVLVLTVLGIGSAAGPVLYGVVALGLHKGARWAVIAATVLAVLGLGNLPFGLALGLLTLWTLHVQGGTTELAV